jgi:hypothetical protein
LPVRETLGVARALGMEGRFGAWRGVSGRRYIVTTFSIDRLADIGTGVLIAVRYDQAGRSHVAAILSGTAVEAMNDPNFRTADAVDVHLLEEDAAARDRIVSDLSGTGAINGPAAIANAHPTAQGSSDEAATVSP